MKKLNETFDINEIRNALESNPETVEKGMNEMDKMFENTGIGKLAKEITEELDIENMINNGGIQDLFSGGNMANIMQTISSKMSDNQDMNSDDLMKEATNICSSMQGNPLFSSLMGGMSGDLMGSLTGQNMPEKPEQPVKNIKIGDKKHDPNKTRERLQKKLKEKTTVEKKKIR